MTDVFEDHYCALVNFFDKLKVDDHASDTKDSAASREVEQEYKELHSTIEYFLKETLSSTSVATLKLTPGHIYGLMSPLGDEEKQYDLKFEVKQNYLFKLFMCDEESMACLPLLNGNTLAYYPRRFSKTFFFKNNGTTRWRMNGHFLSSSITGDDCRLTIRKSDFPDVRWCGLIDFTTKRNLMTIKNEIQSAQGQILYKGGIDDVGRMHGCGTLYTGDGRIFFCGEFNYGEFSHGTSHDYYSDLSVYTGAFKVGKKHGYGILYNPSEDKTYCGDFEDGLFCGRGDFYEKEKMVYSGCWKDGKRHGFGISFRSDGETKSYEGEWSEGYKCGLGTQYLRKCLIYVGMFDHDSFHGNGEFQNRKGESVFGTWDHGTLLKPIRPIPQRFRICHQCVRCNVATKTCAKCRQARYCSPVCQSGDWKNHKSVCMNTRMAMKKIPVR